MILMSIEHILCRPIAIDYRIEQSFAEGDARVIADHGFDEATIHGHRALADNAIRQFADELHSASADGYGGHDGHDHPGLEPCERKPRLDIFGAGHGISHSLARAIGCFLINSHARLPGTQ